MAQDATLVGLRNQILTSLFGRRIGFEPGNSSDTNPDYLAGPRGFREPISGFSSGGSTVTSTSVTTPLPGYGPSMVGATAASATTAYNLAAPIPGVRKIIFNPTTGQAVVGTTDAGAFICASGSVTSTLGIITLAPKGSFIELMGLSTALWGVIGIGGISTGGYAVTIV